MQRCLNSRQILAPPLPSQYVADYTYQDLPCEVYMSSFAEGKKENNYTLLVRKDTQAPVLLRFVGYDRLFGSHYDEYDIIYSSFTALEPNPTVFDLQKSELCVHGVYI